MGTVIVPTEDEVSHGLLHIVYCCCSDQYMRITEDNRIHTGTVTIVAKDSTSFVTCMCARSSR